MGVEEVLFASEPYFFYRRKLGKGDGKAVTAVYDLVNKTSRDISKASIHLADIHQGKVLYTKKNPNEDNSNLYFLDLTNEKSKETLIEENVSDLAFSGKQRIYYYSEDSVGRHFLISNSVEGNHRVSSVNYVSHFLFEAGDYAYFIRAYGSNSALCRIPSLGGEMEVIAYDIHRYLQFKDGYLYYLDSEDTLYRVRMDGSSQEALSAGVEEDVLLLKDRVFFLQSFVKEIPPKKKAKRKSKKKKKDVPPIFVERKDLFGVSLGEEGSRKIIYDATVADRYDEKTIYAVHHKGSKENPKDCFMKVDAKTYQAEELFEIKQVPPKKKWWIYVILGIAVIAALVVVWLLLKNQ